MIKQLMKVTILPLLIGSLFADDWAIESVYLDLGLGRTDAGGIHGCEMAPDGNIWIVGYGSVLAAADADEQMVEDHAKMLMGGFHMANKNKDSKIIIT